jgi:hypothetical protein
MSRRAAVAALVGGGAIAVAVAQPRIFRSRPGDAFAQKFSSPFFTLGLGDHNNWQAEVGSRVQVRGGPVMRVSNVEAFAPLGPAKTGSTRQRPFMVTFEIMDGSPLLGDMIYSLTHPSRGSFDLFLTASRKSPRLIQAMFN